MSWMRLFVTDSTRSEVAAGPIKGSLLIEPRSFLTANKEWINALRLESGYDGETFDRLIGATLLQAAEWVHFLPASRSDSYSEPGGLLRLAVESACVAFRRADGKFLTGGKAGDLQDRGRERALRYIALIAALVRPLGRCVTHVKVTSADARFVWNPLRESLWAWRRRIDTRNLNVQWLPHADDAAAELAAIWIASRVIPPSSLAHVHQVDDALLDVLVSLIGGRPLGKLSEIVGQAQDAAIELEVRNNGQGSGTGVAAAIEERVIDTLRRLCRDKWTINAPGAHLWHTELGVFLVWRPAAADLLGRLRAEGLPGAPDDADGLARVLAAHGYLSQRAAANDQVSLYYKLQPHVRGIPKQTLEVVKLSDPNMLGLALAGVMCVPARMDEDDERSRPATPQPSAVTPAIRPVSDASDVSADSEPVSEQSPARPTSSNTQLRVPDTLLKRLGTAGAVLHKLIIRQAENGTSLIRSEFGLLIPFPEALEVVGANPQEFLASCEIQGLLVPRTPGRRDYIREAEEAESDLPRRYLLLAPRIARHL